MNIKEIFKDVNSDIEINNLEVDSRVKSENAMFFCIEGLTNDSHDFIPDAIKNGAVCIVHSKELNEIKKEYENVLFVKVDDTKKALAEVADVLYDNPSEKMTVFGVTGTNGKTSISYLIYKILSKFEKSAYNGTIGTILGKKSLPYARLTTPDTLDLRKIFKTACEEEIKSFAIEISSHALDMKRVWGLDVDVAIYTNLSRDHLDYHKTMDNYKKAKAELFRSLKKTGIAIINNDDAEADYFKEAASHATVFTYGKSEGATYRFDNIKLSPNGSEFSLHYNNEVFEIKTNLLSEINIYNLTAAIAAIHQSGKDLKDVIASVKNIDFKIGRFQYVQSSKYSVIVDFAHTPDAFQKIYDFTDSFRDKGAKVLSVFGSAGKRDKGKRPIMGEIASKHSDFIILTEDDNRDEDPVKIAEEIAKGIEETCPYIIEASREEAIKKAFQKANEGDLILILGKGNETFMYVGDKSAPWDGDDTVAARYAEI